MQDKGDQLAEAAAEGLRGWLFVEGICLNFGGVSECFRFSAAKQKEWGSAIYLPIYLSIYPWLLMHFKSHDLNLCI